MSKLNVKAIPKHKESAKDEIAALKEKGFEVYSTSGDFVRLRKLDAPAESDAADAPKKAATKTTSRKSSKK